MCLDVDDEEQQKKQCTGERSELRLSLPPPLPDDGDEILWCELVGHDNTTEQILQGAARKKKGMKRAQTCTRNP